MRCHEKLRGEARCGTVCGVRLPRKKTGGTAAKTAFFPRAALALGQFQGPYTWGCALALLSTRKRMTIRARKMVQLVRRARMRLYLKPTTGGTRSHRERNRSKVYSTLPTTKQRNAQAYLHLRTSKAQRMAAIKAVSGSPSNSFSASAAFAPRTWRSTIRHPKSQFNYTSTSWESVISHKHELHYKKTP